MKGFIQLKPTENLKNFTLEKEIRPVIIWCNKLKLTEERRALHKLKGPDNKKILIKILICNKKFYSNKGGAVAIQEMKYYIQVAGQ